MAMLNNQRVYEKKWMVRTVAKKVNFMCKKNDA